MATQVMIGGSRYELRSLPSKRKRYPIPSDDSKQLCSPTKHVKKTKAVPLIKGGFGISSDEAKFMAILRWGESSPSSPNDPSICWVSWVSLVLLYLVQTHEYVSRVLLVMLSLILDRSCLLGLRNPFCTPAISILIIQIQTSTVIIWVCDKLPDSADEDVDEGSEVSAESYAFIAVNHYKVVGNFELVDTGPLAAGNIPGGRIFHLNYKAKNKDVPGAVVQTFFSEMTKTQKDGITVHRNICLGPTDSLPEKADTKGCLYCLSHNIHHFECIYAFRTGRLQFWKTLCYEVFSLSNYIRKGKSMKKKQNFSPKFRHPGVVFFGKEFDSTTTHYATAALCMFNVEQGTNFELVKIGSCESKFLTIGHVKHLNFEAKRNNDPEAPLHTFFAQVIIDTTFLFAHFCKCLGPSDSLPDEVELHGCQLCIPRYSSIPLVRHPPGPGYLIGHDS